MSGLSLVHTCFIENTCYYVYMAHIAQELSFVLARRAMCANTDLATRALNSKHA
jgi:hypothetical protein